jgi:uncharacterized protein
MRILVLCDDKWHPARVVRQGLSILPLEGGEWHFIEDVREFDPASLAAYATVILSKSNNVSAADEAPWMTEAVQAAFDGYVEGGGGLLAIHSGTAGYAQAPVLRRLLGGVFVQHPPQCPVEVAPQAGHPLCAGSSAFTLLDEHYFMALDDPQAQVFLTTTSEHGSQPGGWLRTQGAGRVCVLTPGHNLPVWQHPSFQALLGNALDWSCRQSNL